MKILDISVLSKQHLLRKISRAPISSGLMIYLSPLALAFHGTFFCSFKVHVKLLNRNAKR
ncbi:hypothetical protein JHK82_053646 [Glycine max]|nr:hypothetical protein JHK82_053646 [Glycine max]